jgi:hypothetical protein
MYDHAGMIFTNEELLMALVAERLDRLADRMVYRGCTKLALYGSAAHVEWMHENIMGLQAFPIGAYIAGPDAALTSADVMQYRDRPLVSIDHPRIADLADAVLIADDRFEDDMYQKAMRWLPPGIIVHRLYERLNIGKESLVRATIANRGPAPRVVVRPTRPASVPAEQVANA